MATYDGLPEVVGRANAWVAQEGVEVINVETVVAPGRRTPENIEMRRSGEMSSDWYQFVRVWFRRR